MLPTGLAALPRLAHGTASSCLGFSDIRVRSGRNRRARAVQALRDFDATRETSRKPDLVGESSEDGSLQQTVGRDVDVNR
jgi:hypothetical protein